MAERDEARARRVVEAEMAKRGWNVTNLVAEANDRGRSIDPGTVGDFLNGKRWPRRATRSVLELVLDLPFGSLEDLATGAIEEIFVGIDVGGAAEDDDWRFQRPEGITDEAWRTLRAEFEGIASVIARKYQDDR